MYTLIRQLKKIELYNISGKLLLVKSINYENTKSNGYAFQIEMTLLVSINDRSIKEIPITFYERSLGDSKMSKAIVYEAVKFLLANIFTMRQK